MERKKGQGEQTGRQVEGLNEMTERKAGRKQEDGKGGGTEKNTGRIREENKREEARERKTGRIKLRKNAPRRRSGREAGGRGSPDRPCCSAPLERDGLPLRPRRLGRAAP